MDHVEITALGRIANEVKEGKAHEDVAFMYGLWQRAATLLAEAAEQKANQQKALMAANNLLQPAIPPVGSIVEINGRRFKVTGYKGNRPRYPISATCLNTGRAFKLPRDVKIISQ